MGTYQGRKEYAQFDFTGEWLPSVDSSMISAKNFRVLRNMRYNEASIESIQGYTPITSNGLPITNGIIRGGLQRTTDGRDSNYSTIVISANTSGGTQAIYHFDTEPPTAGSMPSTAEFSETVTGLETRLVGRVGPGSRGHVTYLNEKVNKIWSGDLGPCAAVFAMDDSAFDGAENAVDYTLEMNNLNNTADFMTIAQNGKAVFLVMSTRRLSGVYLKVKTANTTADALVVKYWNGSSFAAATGVTDGTESPAGTTMGQSGLISFDLATAAKPFHYEGVFFFAYTFEIDTVGVNAQIFGIDVQMPWQEYYDIWDGVFRQCVQAQYYNATKWEDYTLAVSEPSDVNLPTGMELKELAYTTDRILLMFEDRLSALKLTMLAGRISTATSAMTVKYWDGTQFLTVSSLKDGTSDTSRTLNKTGVVTWDVPAATSEKPKSEFGTFGYVYEITFSANFTAAEDVTIDLIYGIPATMKTVPYSWSIQHKNRTFYANYAEGFEKNCLDFTMANAPDVINGLDSSMGGIQRLYFGGTEALTGGATLYNRFGSNIFSLLVVFKNSEMYLLAGDSPEDFKIFPVSSTVGCPCPMTITVAETGFQMAEEIERNIVLWVSYAGPMLFDGAILRRLKGIEKYFDPFEDDCINYAHMWKSVAWFSTTHKEWNFCFPRGLATENNTWLVFDLIRQKWYEKDPAGSGIPTGAIPALASDGVRYIYAGIGGEDLFRLENGTTWNGTNIVSEVEPGDHWPSGNIWHMTRIRHLKLVTQRIDEDVDLEVTYYQDSEAQTGFNYIATDWADVTVEDWADVQIAVAALTYIPLSAQAGLNQRLTRVNTKLNLLAYIHTFGFKVSTSASNKAFQPIAWGYIYDVERDDLKAPSG